jgi:tripartite-type tricarboxylate transporter receptor subunit TctC
MGFDGSIVVAPNMLNAPFNPITDFAPVTKLNDATIILVANPSVPVKNISDIVALAKSKPEGLQFSSSGPGTTPHLAGELLALRAGIKVSHIPYKGGGQAVTDAVAGHFPIFFTVVPTVASYIKQGRLNAIAVASDKRSPAWPDIPTIAELGVPDFNVSSWYGILAPAKTPKAIIDRLQKDIAAVLAIPEVRDRYLNNAFDPIASTPEAFAAQIKADYARWGQVVKDANLKQQ